MRQATNVNLADSTAGDAGLRPAPQAHDGNGRHGGAKSSNNGNGRVSSTPRTTDKLDGDHAVPADARNVPVRDAVAAGNGTDPLRVDVQSARRQSSARRRPTRDVEAAHDPERDGITADDPTGGAFESTWSMSGRTPASPSSPDAPGGSDAAAAQTPRPLARHGGDPQVIGKALPRPGAAGGSRVAPMNKHVCPFCGTKREDPLGECPACGLPDNEETRGATVARVGPWFVLQARNPSAPGMRFSVLRELVRNGQISAGSIVRGPATHQLWTYAARVRGLAHIFGVCWSCNRRLPNPQPGEEPDDFCVYCGAMQTAPTNPDQQLEALGTSETIGTGLSNMAGQVAQLRPGGGHRRPQLESGSNARNAAQVQFRETAAPTGHLARRPHMPRPLPPAPRDGGDALLTTRELATAFNLDRKRGVADTLGKVPWLKLLVAIFVVAVAIFGVWLASRVLWEPVSEGLGIESTPPAATSDDAP